MTGSTQRLPAAQAATASPFRSRAGGRRALSFADLSERSNRVANGLRRAGVRRGDRILLMLGNCPALWEAMLAAMKLGAVIIPASVLLTEDDVRERLARARAGFWITEADNRCRLRPCPLAI